MRRLEEGMEKPAVRGRYGHPSFSSTLLDSIYRSMDDDEEEDDVKPTRGAPDSRKYSHSNSARWSPPVTRPKKQAHPAVTRPRPHFHSTTSSSSGNSSYGGFSSSEAESVDPAHPGRLRPVRTEKIRPASLPPPPPEKKNKKKKIRPANLSSIRSKLRSPTSPAARLAGFLNSLFTHKPKPGAGSGEESACSSASSFSRSCLMKKPMTSSAANCNGTERSVKFQLTSGGGEKTREESRYGRETAVANVMTWQGLEEEEDDVSSESSSDLFELENLATIGRYRDELPVFETTDLGGLRL